MLSGKSNLPPRSASTEIEPTGIAPLTNEVRRSTLSETLTQANSNISSMDQHPGKNLLSYFMCSRVIWYYNFEIFN